jgi:hypothetical protein
MLKHLSLVKDETPRLNQLKLVVLDCPYDTVTSDQTIDLLGKIIRFKIESYRQEYPYGILPFDGIDMVGTHYLLCETTKDGQLDPIMGIKTITQKKCHEFNLTHPVLGLIGNDAQYADHAKAVKTVIEGHDSKQRNLGYFGSWTIRPDIRKDRDFVNLCQQVVAGMSFHIANHYDFASIVTVAVSRFKVEAFHKFVGFRPLTHQGTALSPFISKVMMGEQCSCSFMEREWFTPELKTLAFRYKDVWDSRLEISAGTAAIEKTSKAA